MFELAARVVLDERESAGPYPRHALRLVDPPVPVEVQVAALLPDPKPRWMKRPIWLGVAGIDRHPTQGLLYAWVLSEANDWYGVVSMELGSRDGKLTLVLPGQLVPAKALSPINPNRPVTGTADSR